MKHSTLTVPTITPNLLMIQFLNAVRKHERWGGHLATYTGLDPAETAIALSLGVRQGWLTPECVLTTAGLAVIRPVMPRETASVPPSDRRAHAIDFADLYRDRTGLSKSLYDQVCAQMPALLVTALEEIHVGNRGFEDFETRHDLPSRSAKVVIRLALECYALTLAAIV
jgi:hypothetical protein